MARRIRFRYKVSKNAEWQYFNVDAELGPKVGATAKMEVNVFGEWTPLHIEKDSDDTRKR